MTVLGAWKNASGQQELDELFAHLADSFSDCTSFEFELLEAEVRGDTAYTVGLEHTSASVDGVPRTYTLRATQIYRREDGTWRVAHRHGSAPPEKFHALPRGDRRLRRARQVQFGPTVQDCTLALVPGARGRLGECLARLRV